MRPWRLELCHKDKASLHSLFSVLRQRPKICQSLQGFNVPNKSKGCRFLRDTISWLACSEDLAEVERIANNRLEIVLHYSMKYQASDRSTIEKCAMDFKKLGAARDASGILVVTGSKPRKNDSLKLLEELGKGKGGRGPPPKRAVVPLHVAFNPFLEDPTERDREYERLRSKLRTGLCKGIWLQIGSDTNLLVEGLEYIRSLEGGANVAVYGGLFLPSKQLLAQQKFRPWAGVKLSQAYLNDLGTAMDITRRILAIFSAHGVVPLFESRVYKVSQLDDLANLLECAEETEGKGHNNQVSRTQC